MRPSVVQPPSCVYINVNLNSTSFATFLRFGGRIWAVNFRGLGAETMTGTNHAFRPVTVTILIVAAGQQDSLAACGRPPR
jgi:hypothetical protein